MSVTKLAVPFLALMVALTACGGNSQPAGGAGGSVAAGGAGGAPGPTSGSGGSLGAGGSQAPALGGAGGMVAAGGTTGAGGTTAPDGSAGSDSGAGGLAIDGGLDTADLRPETGVGLPGDARANDTAAMVICPKQVSGGKVPGVSAADFCATFETACMFNNLGVAGQPGEIQRSFRRTPGVPDGPALLRRERRQQEQLCARLRVGHPVLFAYFLSAQSL
jgi:hypothetical protein